MAIYGNGYPTYPYYQPQQQYTPTNTQPSSMIWVQGEAGAKSYLVAPNTSVPLWDSESQTIYIKSADASGMPSLKIIDYTIRDSNQQTPVSVVKDEQEVDYVTHKELTALESRLKKQISKLAKEDSADDDE